MTVTARGLESLSDHWAISAVGEEKVALAHAQAVRLYVGGNLSERMTPTVESWPTDLTLVEHVALAYELIASEGVDELLKAADIQDSELAERSEAAASQAFALLRALPLDGSSLEVTVKQILRLGALAYCSDRWAEFRGWLRDRSVTPEILTAGPSWDSRVLSDLGEVWIRLLRKDGWQDLEAVASIITRLRGDQAERERDLFEEVPADQSKQATGWRLVALYHWARLSELVATYLLQGEPGDISTELEFHFDRAIEAAAESSDPEFVVVLKWQRVMAHRMVSGSLWAAARIGPEIRTVVSTMGQRRSMFEMLPPQRIAILEQGLLDPASAAVVIDLPTSAGKTTLAEFKMVQALNQFQQNRGWVAYVAPTRALVGQITRRLRADLGPSDLNVEELTAAVEVDEIELNMLQGEEAQFDILVSTPEKLNLVIRSGVIERPLALVVLDEAHNIEDEERGVRIELLLANIKRDCPQSNFLLMMPFVPNGRQLARWLAPQTGKSISLASMPWQPNDRIVGLVEAEAPEGGRGRDWSLTFEPLTTSSRTLVVEEKYHLGRGPMFDETFSKMKDNLGRLAGGASLALSSRGTAIVVCGTIPTVWTNARLISEQLDAADDPDIEFVCRFLETEVSQDFELVHLLRRRVAVHHSGLSDETRALIEWLAETGKLRVLVATSGISQGLNFPVSSIFLSSTNVSNSKGYSREMSAREFWNLAGRAGRIDQDSIGVVGLSAKPGARIGLAAFVARQTEDLVSRLVSLLNELEESGNLLGLERSLYGDQWADFRSYVAHLFAQKKTLDSVIAETELLLRSTFGYSMLSESTPADREKGARLLAATRAYATDLSGRVETATLADSTGFTPEGIRSAMIEMRQIDTVLAADNWAPSSLFGDPSTSALPDLMRVMAGIPQIRDSIEKLGGSGHGVGDQAARIASDWVSGASVEMIASRYFSGDGLGPTESLTAATRAIYRHLTMAGTWGLSALSKLPASGIDFESLSPVELRRINLLGAMLYHGVDTETGVVMRMSSVPRSVAKSVGDEFISVTKVEIPTPSSARTFLSALSVQDWDRHVPTGARMSGADYSRLWRVLSGDASPVTATALVTDD